MIRILLATAVLALAAALLALAIVIIIEHETKNNPKF